MRSRTPVWPAITIVLTGVSLFVACGVKGPPRAPTILVPSAVGDLEVRRIGSQVYVQFAVPAANTDGSTPADLDRVEVYGLTTDPEQDPATPPPLDDWLEAATLVASFDVRRPEGEALDPDQPEMSSVGPGEQVVVVEVLEPELLEPYVFEDDSDSEDDEPDEVEDDPVALPLVSPPLPRPPRRTYLVRGVSTRGRESAPSTRSEIPLTDPTLPPPPPTITYTETEFLVEWTPAIGARRPIQAPDGSDSGESTEEGDDGEEDDDEDEDEDEPGNVAVVEYDADAPLPSRPVVTVATPSDYLIYAVGSSRAGDVASLPAPLNMPEVGLFSYRDQTMRFGMERCYVVRVLDVLDSLQLQGPASPPSCVVPMDTFPPGPPTGVVAVASEGAISLVWDPNQEPDIAGYLVLRRASAGATLQTLTPEPIEGTSYRDEEVTADQNYVYAVMAVDDATPSNVSAASIEITEQAR